MSLVKTAILIASLPVLLLNIPLASANGDAAWRIQTTAQKQTPSRRAVRPRSATVRPGSLKANIVRLAHQYGWRKVVWHVDVDYHWVGTTRIRAHRLQGVLAQLLAPYPLQAAFYEGNHILVIQPRSR